MESYSVVRADSYENKSKILECSKNERITLYVKCMINGPMDMKQQAALRLLM